MKRKDLQEAIALQLHFENGLDKEQLIDKGFSYPAIITNKLLYIVQRNGNARYAHQDEQEWLLEQMRAFSREVDSNPQEFGQYFVENPVIVEYIKQACALNFQNHQGEHDGPK